MRFFFFPSGIKQIWAKAIRGHISYFFSAWHRRDIPSFLQQNWSDIPLKTLRIRGNRLRPYHPCFIHCRRSSVEWETSSQRSGHPELDTLHTRSQYTDTLLHQNNKLHTYTHHRRTAVHRPGGRPREKTPFRGGRHAHGPVSSSASCCCNGSVG